MLLSCYREFWEMKSTHLESPQVRRAQLLSEAAKLPVFFSQEGTAEPNHWVAPSHLCSEGGIPEGIFDYPHPQVGDL